jgi:hypothetical protein
MVVSLRIKTIKSFQDGNEEKLSNKGKIETTTQNKMINRLQMILIIKIEKMIKQRRDVEQPIRSKLR